MLIEKLWFPEISNEIGISCISELSDLVWKS